jgi:hypothetical protein
MRFLLPGMASGRGGLAVIGLSPMEGEASFCFQPPKVILTQFRAADKKVCSPIFDCIGHGEQVRVGLIGTGRKRHAADVDLRICPPYIRAWRRVLFSRRIGAS